MPLVIFISKIMSAFLEDVVRKKWRNLRDAYNRAKTNRKKKSGVAGDAEEMPATWKHFVKLIFLDDNTGASPR